MKYLIALIIILISGCAAYIPPSSHDTFVNDPVICESDCKKEMSSALIWISRLDGIQISIATDSMIQTIPTVKDAYRLNFTVIKRDNSLIINSSCPNVYICTQDFGQMIKSLKKFISEQK